MIMVSCEQLYLKFSYLTPLPVTNSTNITMSPKEGTSGFEPFQGIHSIIKAATGMPLQWLFQPNFCSVNSKKIQSSPDRPLLFPIFTSPQRTLCLQICGWGFDRKDSLDHTLAK